MQMTSRDFAFIGCRLLALYWAVMTIVLIPSLGYSLASWKVDGQEYQTMMTDVVSYTFVPVIFYGLVALVLWIGAARITRYLVPDGSETNAHGAATPGQVQSIAFAAVGIYIVSISLPDLGGVLFRIFRFEESDADPRMLSYTMVELFELSASLALGVFLVLGSKGLSASLARLRKTGVD